MDRLTKRLSNGVIQRSDVMGDSVMSRLAAYEDTGLMPEAVAAMNQFDQSQCHHLLAKNGELTREVARLRAELEAANARWEEWEEMASDNTGYTLSCLDGIYAVSDPQGYVVCEFLRGATENGGAQE